VPLYEYQCTRCGHRFEKIEKVSGPHAKRCPKCAGKVERLMAPPAIQFKGTGWYVTDYARTAASGDSTGAESEKSGKAEKESKGAVPTKEAKQSKEERAKKET
jgi:putative FmdB family regulatory protein